jgi:hypothetical protein
MKTEDKARFDMAKTRVNGSKLDDVSKQGLVIALDLSGEACNGLTHEQRLETVARAIFGLTIAVSHFMAHAPDHTAQSINDAILGHVGNCAKILSQAAVAEEKKGSTWRDVAMKAVGTKWFYIALVGMSFSPFLPATVKTICEKF